MHTSGKVAAFIILLAALPFAIWKTAELGAKRNKIAAEVIALKKTRDKNMADLATAKRAKAAVENELTRLTDSWGRQWTVPGQATGQPGQFVLNVGLAQGLGAQEVAQKKPPQTTAYLFVVGQDGNSAYLGEFIAQSDAQRTLVTLARPPLNGELASWPQQAEFRLRERIPPGTRSIFHDLRTQQGVADQEVISETAKLKIQDNHIAASQKTLDRRMSELNGDPAAPQTADPEITQGLVDTLRKEEAERNAIAKDVDALRRALSDNYAKLESVLVENSQAVDALAAQAGPETASKLERSQTR